MRLFARRVGSGQVDAWQPQLYVVLVALALLVAFAIAFVIQNDERIEVDFVLASARVSLIWVILLSLAVGVLAGVALSQLYRRRETGRSAGD